MDSSSPGPRGNFSGHRGDFLTVENSASSVARPIASNVELIPVSEVDDSVVVAAPTGSGKTVIFELAIMRLLKQHWPFTENCFKIVYMAPIKALCNEKYTDWKNKFSKIGVKCLELTGDTEEEVCSIDGYHLILTTPEKWDSLTRKWKENHFPVQKVKLFMIDEVHLLNEEKRGPTLEAVVCRMKLAQSLANNSVNIRFIAVSATIPNVEDITQWLSTGSVEAKRFQVGEECRPVELTKVVLGYPVKQNQSPYMFDISLNYKLKSLILKYARGKPSLIFCNTRKGVLQAANTLSRDLSVSVSEAQRSVVNEAVKNIQEGSVKGLLTQGIGCHHAGLSMDDRHLVEDLFRRGCLPVLVATSTLAMGINLPAHLVIIKSTEYYVNGGYQEYSESQVLQMIGRAGRPQFDSDAIAVIMTKESQKKRYENLIEGVQAVESNLHGHLTEHLNAEVVLRTIPDIALAMDWIRSTFLYIRTQKNPAHYKLPRDLTKAQVEKRLQDWCLRELNGLVRYKLATLTDGYDVFPTAEGTIMAQYCISFETMKLFMNVNGQEDLKCLLNILVEAHEFKDIMLRVNERKTLNSLNSNANINKLRFRIEGKIKSQPLKINCLIQATLGCAQIFDAALIQDRAKIFRVGRRLTQGLVQLFWLRDDAYQGLLSSILLAKCFVSQLWEDSDHVTRQLPGIGPVLSSHLVAAKKVSFEDILRSNPRDLELILNRHPPFGNTLIESVKVLPQFKLDARIIEDSGDLLVNVEIKNYEDVLKSKNAHDMFYLLIGNSKNRILHKSKFPLDSLIKRGGFYNISLAVADIPSTTVFVHVLSKNLVGLDVSETLGDHGRISPSSDTGDTILTQAKSAGSEKAAGTKRKKKTQNTAASKKLAQPAASGCSTPMVKGSKGKLLVGSGQRTLSAFSFTPTPRWNKPTFAEKMESIDKALKLVKADKSQSPEEELSQTLSGISINDSAEDKVQQTIETVVSQNSNSIENHPRTQDFIQPSQDVKSSSLDKTSDPYSLNYDTNGSAHTNFTCFPSIFKPPASSSNDFSTAGRSKNTSHESLAFNIFEPLKGRPATDLAPKSSQGTSANSEVQEILDAQLAKIAASWQNHPFLMTDGNVNTKKSSLEPTRPASGDACTNEKLQDTAANKTIAKDSGESAANFPRNFSNTDFPGQNSVSRSSLPRSSTRNFDENGDMKVSSGKRYEDMNPEDLSKYAVDDEEFEEFMQALHEGSSKSTLSPVTPPAAERVVKQACDPDNEARIEKKPSGCSENPNPNASESKVTKQIPVSLENSNPCGREDKIRKQRSCSLEKSNPPALSKYFSDKSESGRENFQKQVESNSYHQSSNYQPVSNQNFAFSTQPSSSQERQKLFNQNFAFKMHQSSSQGRQTLTNQNFAFKMQPSSSQERQKIFSQNFTPGMQPLSSQERQKLDFSAADDNGGKPFFSTDRLLPASCSNNFFENHSAFERQPSSSLERKKLADQSFAFGRQLSSFQERQKVDLPIAEKDKCRPFFDTEISQTSSNLIRSPSARHSNNFIERQRSNLPVSMMSNNEASENAIYTAGQTRSNLMDASSRTDSNRFAEGVRTSLASTIERSRANENLSHSGAEMYRTSSNFNRPGSMFSDRLIYDQSLNINSTENKCAKINEFSFNSKPGLSWNRPPREGLDSFFENRSNQPEFLNPSNIISKHWPHHGAGNDKISNGNRLFDGDSFSAFQNKQQSNLPVTASLSCQTASNWAPPVSVSTRSNFHEDLKSKSSFAGKFNEETDINTSKNVNSKNSSQTNSDGHFFTKMGNSQDQEHSNLTMSLSKKISEQVSDIGIGKTGSNWMFPNQGGTKIVPKSADMELWRPQNQTSSKNPGNSPCQQVFPSEQNREISSHSKMNIEEPSKGIPLRLRNEGSKPSPNKIQQIVLYDGKENQPEPGNLENKNGMLVEDVSSFGVDDFPSELSQNQLPEDGKMSWPLPPCSASNSQHSKNDKPTSTGKSLALLKNYNSQGESTDTVRESQKSEAKSTANSYVTSEPVARLSLQAQPGDLKSKLRSLLNGKVENSEVKDKPSDILQQIEVKMKGSQQSAKCVSSAKSNQTQPSLFKYRIPSEKWSIPIPASSKIVSGPIQRKEKLGIGKVLEKNGGGESSTQGDTAPKPITTKSNPITTQSNPISTQSKPSNPSIESSKNKSVFTDIITNKNGSLSHQTPGDKNQLITVGQASRAKKDSVNLKKSLIVEPTEEGEPRCGKIIKPPQLKMFSLKKYYKTTKDIPPSASLDKVKKSSTPPKIESRPEDKRSSSESKNNTPLGQAHKVSSCSSGSKSGQTPFSKLSHKNQQAEKRRKKAFFKSIKKVENPNENFEPFEVDKGLLCTEIMSPGTCASHSTQAQSESESDITSEKSSARRSRNDNLSTSEAHYSSDRSRCLSPQETAFSRAEQQEVTRFENKNELDAEIDSYKPYSPENPSQPLNSGEIESYIQGLGTNPRSSCLQSQVPGRISHFMSPSNLSKLQENAPFRKSILTPSYLQEPAPSQLVQMTQNHWQEQAPKQLVQTTPNYLQEPAPQQLVQMTPNHWQENIPQTHFSQREECIPPQNLNVTISFSQEYEPTQSSRFAEDNLQGNIQRPVDFGLEYLQNQRNLFSQNQLNESSRYQTNYLPQNQLNESICYQPSHSTQNFMQESNPGQRSFFTQNRTSSVPMYPSYGQENSRNQINNFPQYPPNLESSFSVPYSYDSRSFGDPPLPYHAQPEYPFKRSGSEHYPSLQPHNMPTIQGLYGSLDTRSLANRSSSNGSLANRRLVSHHGSLSQSTSFNPAPLPQRGQFTDESAPMSNSGSYHGSLSQSTSFNPAPSTQKSQFFDESAPVSNGGRFPSQRAFSSRWPAESPYPQFHYPPSTPVHPQGFSNASRPPISHNLSSNFSYDDSLFELPKDY